MKFYKLTLNTASPSRQVLNVPTDTPKYGILANVSNGKHAIRNLSASIEDGAQTYTAEEQEGGYMFTLSSGAEERDREVRMRMDAEPLSVGDGFELPAAGWATAITPPTSQATTAEIKQITYDSRGNYVVWSPDLHQYADTEPITIDTDLSVGEYKKVQQGGRVVTKFFCAGVLPADTYYADEFRPLPSGGVGTSLHTSAPVVLNETAVAHPDGELPDVPDYSEVAAGDLSAETFCLSGVSYVPQTLMIGDVEYTVLVAANSTAE